MKLDPGFQLSLPGVVFSGSLEAEYGRQLGDKSINVPQMDVWCPDP